MSNSKPSQNVGLIYPKQLEKCILEEANIQGTTSITYEEFKIADEINRMKTDKKARDDARRRAWKRRKSKIVHGQEDNAELENLLLFRDKLLKELNMVQNSHTNKEKPTSSSR